MLSLIVAMARSSRVIGLKGELPWTLSADLKRFRRLTTGHTVVMGRKTWESLPSKSQPLPNRQNIVLTRDKSYRTQVPDGVVVVASLNEALELHNRMRDAHVGENWGDLFVIGGERLFDEAYFLADRLYVTLVDYHGEGDIFFPYDPLEAFEFLPGEPWLEETPANDNNSNTSWFCVMKRRTT